MFWVIIYFTNRCTNWVQAFHNILYIIVIKKEKKSVIDYLEVLMTTVNSNIKSDIIFVSP